MVHRALLGSIERFVGILIEQYAGAFPLWLAPVQAKILTITDRQNEFAQKVAKELGDQGFRVEADLRNEKVGAKKRAVRLGGADVRHDGAVVERVFSSRRSVYKLVAENKISRLHGVLERAGRVRA